MIDRCRRKAFLAMLTRTSFDVWVSQGEQLGDHWQLGKLGFFRQSREIPLIIRDPRPSADGGRGQRVEACTEHIDIAPTLIEAMGGVVPPVSSLCNCAATVPSLAGFGRSG